MITGDHEGIVKYWQSNMNNVKAFAAHKEAVRDLTYANLNVFIAFTERLYLTLDVRFAPSDMKFATCSDDVSIKVWDFTRCSEETTFAGKLLRCTSQYFTV